MFIYKKKSNYNTKYFCYDNAYQFRSRKNKYKTSEDLPLDMIMSNVVTRETNDKNTNENSLHYKPQQTELNVGNQRKEFLERQADRINENSFSDYVDDYITNLNITENEPMKESNNSKNLLNLSNSSSNITFSDNGKSYPNNKQNLSISEKSNSSIYWDSSILDAMNGCNEDIDKVWSPKKLIPDSFHNQKEFQLKDHRIPLGFNSINNNNINKRSDSYRLSNPCNNNATKKRYYTNASFIKFRDNFKHKQHESEENISLYSSTELYSQSCKISVSPINSTSETQTELHNTEVTPPKFIFDFSNLGQMGNLS